MVSKIFWLASYPKSGNTWFRAFLANLDADADQPVDINALNTGLIASSRQWLDAVLGFDSSELTFDEVEALRPQVYRWTVMSNQAIRPVHKTHDAWTDTPCGEPLHCLDATAGALYLIRNPLDVAVSYANHQSCTVDEAIERMASDAECLEKSRVRYNNQVRQRLLSWSEHVLSWVDAPGLVCRVIRYEDMICDPLATFSAAARFLGRSTDLERLARAIRFSDFKELAQQESIKTFREKPPGVSRFFRQGRSGDWRTQLSSAQVARVIGKHGDVMRRFGYLTAPHTE